MAKERLSVDYYFLAFEGKTLEEAEQIAIASLEGCERPKQAKIAFNALELKYDNYKAKDLEDDIKLADKIRLESKNGATKEYLKNRFNLSMTKINNILKDTSKKESFEDDIPVLKKKDVVTEEFKELVANKKARKPAARKKK